MNLASYTGYYINLDRSPDRRREVEAQLEACRLADRYQRFPAVDGMTLAQGRLSPGAVGCFHSHYEALREGRSSGQCVHILEDDVLLSKYTASALHRIIENGTLDRFDLFYTEALIPIVREVLLPRKELFESIVGARKNPSAPINFRIVDITKLYRACTSSYLVGTKSIDRVLEVLKRELDIGPSLPIDLYYQKLARAGKLKIGCLFPYATSVRLEHILDTTIQKVGPDRRKQAMLYALVRYSFYIDRDLENYARSHFQAIAGAGPAQAADLHSAIIDYALKFVASDTGA